MKTGVLQPLEHLYEQRGEHANESQDYDDEKQTDATPDFAHLQPEFCSEATRLLLEYVYPLPDRQPDRFD